MGKSEKRMRGRGAAVRTPRGREPQIVRTRRRGELGPGQQSSNVYLAYGLLLTEIGYWYTNTYGSTIINYHLRSTICSYPYVSSELGVHAVVLSVSPRCAWCIC